MINKQIYTFSSQQADFAVCEKSIKKHSKTFYFAFSQLPKEQAQSIFAIYAFCRTADDIVDLTKNSDELARLYEKLEAFEQGEIPDEPIFRALAVVFDHYEMEIQPFYDMLNGQAKDLEFKQPNTLADLQEYAYYVAGSVGLMLLPILSKHAPEIQEPAKKLGEAMQITNILRDIGEDYRMGRIYLPQEMMTQFHVCNADLGADRPNSQLIELWEYLAQIAEQAYDESLDMLPLIEPAARKPLYLAAVVYREILTEIRTHQYQMLTKRQAVGRIRKLELFHQATKELHQLTAGGANV